jgi:hypothetical protein
MLYLADCYERIGRSASAWTLLLEASSQAAATLPNQAAVHCPHAGPAGGTADGHGCGTRCESYCRLVAKSCADAYAKQYGSDMDACLAECTTIDAGKAYSTAQSGDALHCRIHSAARAIDPKTARPKQSCVSKHSDKSPADRSRRGPATRLEDSDMPQRVAPAPF